MKTIVKELLESEKMIYFHEKKSGKNELRVVTFGDISVPDLVGLMRMQSYMRAEMKEKKLFPVGAILALVINNEPEHESPLLA